MRCLSLYHAQLAYCVVQFLEKDATLTEQVYKDTVFRVSHEVVIFTLSFKGDQGALEVLAQDMFSKGGNFPLSSALNVLKT